jgi:hypothetical protein
VLTYNTGRFKKLFQKKFSIGDQKVTKKKSKKLPELLFPLCYNDQYRISSIEEKLAEIDKVLKNYTNKYQI